jgi:hypothetical protein
MGSLFQTMCSLTLNLRVITSCPDFWAKISRQPVLSTFRVASKSYLSCASYSIRSNACFMFWKACLASQMNYLESAGLI